MDEKTNKELIKHLTKGYKTSISSILDKPNIERCTKRFEGLIEKLGEPFKENLLMFAAEVYLLAFEDYHRHQRIREYWADHNAGPFVSETLKDLYDKFLPDHNIIFW